MNIHIGIHTGLNIEMLGDPWRIDVTPNLELVCPKIGSFVVLEQMCQFWDRIDVLGGFYFVCRING